DKQIWDEFHANWKNLTLECEELLNKKMKNTMPYEDETQAESYTGKTVETITHQRVGQNFFRKAILSSYQSTCCMSGIAIPQLLVASHIVPWAKSEEQRLNPRNGLCLSAIHDKAFDKGLITVLPDMTIKISNIVLIERDNEILAIIADLNNKKVTSPEKFAPLPEFLKWHNENVFIGE
ncbi:MAG: HNH endonuclease, partial [Verrucomicrobiota bacterium]|nr:HNH endonuclease [Verrucomicrobiota bacterium]